MDINITNNVDFNPSQPEHQQAAKNEVKPIAAAADADLRAEAQEYIKRALQIEASEQEKIQQFIDLEELSRYENIRKAAENIINLGI